MKNQIFSTNNYSSSGFVKRNLPLNIICFSHLRWDFVFQRPQQLFTRFSKLFNVYFWEEPVYEHIESPFLSSSLREDNITVLIPHLPEGHSHDQNIQFQTHLIEKFFENHSVPDFAFWYYTPMALEFSMDYEPAIIIYDCMDELSAFKFAPPKIKRYEKLLFSKASLVFTGGYSLYAAKLHEHPHIFPFPSSIDKQHFEKARIFQKGAKDQLELLRPRVGFFGVIDERFDIDLIREMAQLKREWNFILIGPIVKIDPEILPQAENIHYLGSKSYQELPEYLSGWDAALIPFLLNESTRFISPTKTPEYLAAGIPVVSTPIKDVVSPYGEKNLVHIATSANEFISAIEGELSSRRENWLKEVDEFLMDNSWDLTVSKMLQLIESSLEKNNQPENKTTLTA